MLILSVSMVAQKIKIKKGKLFIDKVETTYFNVVGSDYVYSDLETKKPILTATYKIQKISADVKKDWLEITNADKTIKTEIPYEIVSFSLSVKKIVTNLLIRKYHFFSKGKVNYQEIASFFKEKRPLISEEVKKMLKKEAEKQDNLDLIDITVDRNRLAIFKGAAPYNVTKVGKFEFRKAPNFIGTFYLKQASSGFAGINGVDLLDKSSRKVAIATFGTFGKVNVKLPYAKKEFSYTSSIKRSYDSGKENQRKVIEELVKRVIYNGVELGNQIDRVNKAAVEVNRIKLAEAKRNSDNIYDEQGYIIDNKGKKWEGTLTIEFNEIKLPSQKSSGMHDMTEYGNKVGLVYTNKKGKKRSKSFSSKRNIKFCVNQNEKESCYLAAKMKGKGLDLVAGALSSLSFDTSKFYKLIHEDEKMLILYDVQNKKYGIKLKSKKKGFEFNTSNHEKNDTKLSEYIKKELPEDLKNLDYTKKESAMQIVEFLKK